MRSGRRNSLQFLMTFMNFEVAEQKVMQFPAYFKNCETWKTKTSPPMIQKSWIVRCFAPTYSKITSFTYVCLDRFGPIITYHFLYSNLKNAIWIYTSVYEFIWYGMCDMGYVIWDVYTDIYIYTRLRSAVLFYFFWGS